MRRGEKKTEKTDVLEKVQMPLRTDIQVKQSFLSPTTMLFQRNIKHLLFCHGILLCVSWIIVLTSVQ